MRGGAGEARGQETGEVAAANKVTAVKGEDVLTLGSCEGFLAGGEV